MDLYNLVISAKLQKGGGGGDVTVEELNVTSNGTYSASSGYAFDPVNVSVPGIVPSGTINILNNGIYSISEYASANVSVPQGITPSGTSVITANGLYNVTDFSQASVSVPIPSGYIQPAGTSSITSNGIYDITSFASIDVNVSGGGGDHEAENEIIAKTISGTYTNNEVTMIGKYVFTECNYLESVSFASVGTVGISAFYKCSKLTEAILPTCRMLGQGTFYSCSALNKVVIKGNNSMYGIGSEAFRSCSKLMSLYITGSNYVCPLSNNNAFTGTPMSLSTLTGSFGSIYVPSSLVSNFKAANNWSAYADRITSIPE